MYNIILSDGTVLENLELNGNNYIAPGVLEESVFAGRLESVTIEDGENRESFRDLRLMSLRVVDGRSWFVLGEKSWEQKREEALNALVQGLEERLAQRLTGLEKLLEALLGKWGV